MNKAELVSRVDAETSTTGAAAERMAGAVFSAIADALARDEPAAIVVGDELRAVARAADLDVEHRKICVSLPVRKRVQSCAHLESPRARVPYMADCEFSLATLMRIDALHSKLTRFLAAYVAEALGTPRLPRQQAREAESHFVNWTGEKLLRPDFASRVVNQLPVSPASATHAFHTSSE